MRRIELRLQHVDPALGLVARSCLQHVLGGVGDDDEAEHAAGKGQQVAVQKHLNN
jgi:hypothetical protein